MANIAMVSKILHCIIKNFNNVGLEIARGIYVLLIKNNKLSLAEIE